MSLRSMRKLENQAASMSMSAAEEELESGGVSSGSEGSESIDEGPSSCPPAPRVSAFSALMLMDSDAHSSESELEGEESEDVEEEEASSSRDDHRIGDSSTQKLDAETTTTTTPSSQASKKLSKKQKQKAKQKQKQKQKNTKKDMQQQQQQQQLAHANDSDSKENKNDDEDMAILEAAIQATTQQQQKQRAQSQQKTQQQHPLAVNTQNLRGDEELLRIFGRSAVAANQNDGRRRNYAMQARGTRQFHDTTRKGRQATLIAPREYWPPYDGSLELRAVDAPPKEAAQDGTCKWFAFKPSNKYLAASQEYALGQMTMNLNIIATALRSCPYHLECNMALAEHHWGEGEAERAQEHVERILYAFESAAASSGLFRYAAEGIARLMLSEDDEEEDDEPSVPMDPAKTVLVALFRHSQSLSRRGCHGAAFATCQLAYQLDESRDTAGALPQLDYAALRAGQREWLVRVMTAKGAGALAHRGLTWSLYPSPAFTWAMALLEDAEDAGIPLDDHDDISSPDAVCRRAVGLHPRMARMLVAKLVEKGASVDTAFTSAAVTLEELASKRSDPIDPSSSLWDVPDSLLRLYEIAVERQHALWRGSSALSLLRRAVLAAAESLLDESQFAMGLDAAEWMVARASSFPRGGENVYRHLQAATYAEGGALIVPQDDENDGGGWHDDGNDFNVAPQPPPPAPAAAAAERVMRDEDLAGRAEGATGAVGLFLETLLPWVRVQPGAADGEVRREDE